MPLKPAIIPNSRLLRHFAEYSRDTICFAQELGDNAPDTGFSPNSAERWGEVVRIEGCACTLFANCQVGFGILWGRERKRKGE